MSTVTRNAHAFGLVLGLLGIAVGPAVSARLVPEAMPSGWQLDRVVVVMRHGVRPPTKAEPLPGTIPHQPWPAWDVGWGELTHHGEAAVARLADFDRRHYAALLAARCPGPDDVRAVADSDQRTVRTAEVYVATMFPGCAVKVAHRASGEVDPRFSPFEGAPLLAPEEAVAAAEQTLPSGGIAALDAQLAPQLHALDRIIACGAADCAIAGRPTRITAPDGRVKVAGALGIGASLAETLALEYADGKPLAQVGWGRADAATITDLLALHAAEFALTARPAKIARAGSRALLAEVAAAMGDDKAPKISLFVGHDTNLALVGGALGLHWHAAGFAPDDPPPGGALIFERWRNALGNYRLRVVFRSQSLDEMRKLSPIGPTAISPVAFARCAGETGCPATGIREALLQHIP